MVGGITRTVDTWIAGGGGTIYHAMIKYSIYVKKGKVIEFKLNFKIIHFPFRFSPMTI